MAGTSVKGAGTLLPAFTAGQGTVKTGGVRTETESFQSVWNKQTEPAAQCQDTAKAVKKDFQVKEKDAAEPDPKAQQSKETKPSEETGESGQTGRPEESGKSEETEKTEDTGRPEAAGETEKTAQSGEEDLDTVWSGQETAQDDEKISEEVLEVLQTAIVKLMEQIADAFGVSTGQVQEMMKDLQLENSDLLQADKLGTLVLAAGGASDSSSLLTNEALYQNFRELMNGREELLEGAARELNVETEFLETMISADGGLTAEEMTQNIQDPVVERKEESLPADGVQIQNAEALPEEDEETSREDGIKKPSGDMVFQKEDSDVQTQVPSVRLHSGTDREQRQGQPHGSGGQHSANPVLQQTGVTPDPVHTEHTSESSLSTEMDTENIMRQIMDYMKIRIKPDVSNLEMQLHPASLGTLQVQVASKGGVVTAQFITQNEAVKTVLESQMIQLKESFEQQGVKVEAIEVNVQAQQFDRNFEQNRNGQPDSGERKNRTRRIRLNAENGMPLNEELNKEEQLAADIMAVNGNTVDYTA